MREQIDKDIRGEITTRTTVKFGHEEENFIKEIASHSEREYQTTSLKRTLFPSIMCHAAHSGFKATVNELIQHGADVNQLDFVGRTPLHIAANRGQLAVIEILVSEGAEVNVVDHKNRTPLYNAAIKAHEDVCRYLLDQGAKFEGPVEQLTDIILR